jgi:hypothetical protein
MGEYGMWNQTICLTKALYGVFPLSLRLDLWAKSLVAANFYLHSGNKCFLPGVDIFFGTLKS